MPPSPIAKCQTNPREQIRTNKLDCVVGRGAAHHQLLAPLRAAPQATRRQECQQNMRSRSAIFGTDLYTAISHLARHLYGRLDLRPKAFVPYANPSDIG